MGYRIQKQLFESGVGQTKVPATFDAPHLWPRRTSSMFAVTRCGSDKAVGPVPTGLVPGSAGRNRTYAI